MPRYRWDETTNELVKVSDKVPVRVPDIIHKPFCEQIREGYRRSEEKCGRTVWKASTVKRLWGDS